VQGIATAQAKDAIRQSFAGMFSTIMLVNAGMAFLAAGITILFIHPLRAREPARRETA
jgi:hypothetical protein